MRAPFSFLEGLRPVEKLAQGLVFKARLVWEDKTMNHYLAAALLMLAAIGVPMLCAAMGMKVSTRNTWWD